MLARRDRGVLVATAICAAGVPVTAAAWVSSRTAALAGRIEAAGGVPARIGAIDADLTGTVRMSDVALGGLVSAETVEASVALDSLLAGRLRADEIRVASPRVAIQVDGDGDSDLARLARRLWGRERGASPDAGPGRLRRIVVSSGALSARIAGLGELAADAVELIPDAGGIRVVTGAVRLAGHAGPLDVRLRFARSAAELALPQVRFGRVLAVGGAGTLGAEPGPAVAAPDAPRPQDAGAPAAAMARRARLRDVAVGRLAPGRALELRASVEDAGIARSLAIDVLPREPSIALRGDRVPLGALAALAPRGLDLRDAHATGALAIHREPGGLAVELDAALDGAALDHRAIAPVAVPVSAQLRASIAIAPEAIAVSHAEIGLGAARWTASGWWRRGAPASGRLELSLAPAPCGDLLASLPAALRGPLDGMVLGGTFGGQLRLSVDLAAPPGDGALLAASLHDGCTSLAEPPAADVTRLAGPADQVFSDGSHARVGKGEPGWAALARMPPYVAGAFVAAEDARFYDHAGFDLTQIARSLEIDLRERRLARGGSTISQQLVKNAFLPQRRSFDRKLQEAILTWRLEARLDKHQILERYLNLIELGPHVFGLTAAARHWFDAAPRELTVRQAAFLAALTAEPASMSRRVRRAGGLDPDSAARVDVVLRAMRVAGVIDAAQLEAARAAPLGLAATALLQER